MEGWLVLASFIVGWFGFAYWARQYKKRSMAIAGGGGFIVGYLVLGVFASIFLPGDSNGETVGAANREFSISVPDGTKAEAKALIETNWPKLKSVCPGLEKYSDSLKFDGLDDNLGNGPGNSPRVDVRFLIPNDGGYIPKNYRAAGHRCFFGISQDGSKALISKRACQSICVDRDMTSNDNSVLELSLK